MMHPVMLFLLSFPLVSSLRLQKFGLCFNWCRMISNGRNTWAWQCTFILYEH